MGTIDKLIAKLPIKHSVSELWVEPTSDQLSMSRLCLGVLVSYIGFVIYATYIGKLHAPEIAALDSLLTKVAYVVGSVYGVNSGLRMLRERGAQECEDAVADTPVAAPVTAVADAVTSVVQAVTPEVTPAKAKTAT